MVDEIVSAMNDLGWDVYSFDHEDGNGQFETDFTYTDAVSMSDRLVFFRMMVGEIARKHGLFASLDAQTIRRPHRQRRALQHVAGRRRRA